jgi:hypothetical protein
MLETHLVDALMDRRDQLDHRDGLPVEHLERLGGKDQGDRSAVPKVLAVRDRVALELCPDADVLVPLRDAKTDVAQREWRDVDAAVQKPVALPGGNAL